MAITKDQFSSSVQERLKAAVKCCTHQTSGSKVLCTFNGECRMDKPISSSSTDLNWEHTSFTQWPSRKQLINLHIHMYVLKSYIYSNSRPIVDTYCSSDHNVESKYLTVLCNRLLINVLAIIFTIQIKIFMTLMWQNTMWCNISVIG